MRILLIEPAKSPISMAGEDVFLFEPLALEYLAAGVGGDHEVKILDQRIDDTVAETLESFHPDVVGITGYTVHVNMVKDLAARIKGWNQRTVTIVGGHHATVFPRDFDTPAIDIVVVGEGVEALREIVRRLGSGESTNGIPGVCVSTDSGFQEGPPNPPRDLDDLPFPDRNLTAAYRHAYYCEYMQPLASIRTSKGCPFRCNFCALWKIAGGRYLKRRPEDIVRELREIDEEFAEFRRYVRSMDLNFATFSVLTPLPGTDLFEEVEDRLLTHKPEFFDFIHTVLPTALPLEEFYDQYQRLFTTAIPLRNVVSFLLKFRLLDVPAHLVKFRRWSKRLRMLHTDYDRFRLG